MLRVVRSPTFLQLTKKFWTTEEREEFEVWISTNYSAGPVIPRTKGLQKIRYAASGRGTRGGARVVYYVSTKEGEVLLLAAHTKAQKEQFSEAFLQALRKMVPYD